MAGVDTQIIDGILKDYYEDFVSEQVNNKNKLKELFGKPEQIPYGGRERVYTAHVSRNTSPYFAAEDAAFADAGAQGHTQVRVQARKMLARVRLTSEAIADSASSEMAFKSARKDEMAGLVNDIARVEEYALTSYGRGILALADSTVTGTALTVKCPAGVTTSGIAAGSDFGNRFLRTGMWIAAFNPTTGAIRAGVTQVTAVTSSGAGFTSSVSSPSGWTAGDYLAQAANSAVTDSLDTSFDKATMGMLGMVDDGTYLSNYFGVDRSKWTSFNSYVKASTGALSFDLLQQVSDVVDQKLGGRIDTILCHHSVRRVYLKLLEADRRYIGAQLTRPDGGTVAFKQLDDITMGEVPVIAIRDFPLGTMMLVDKKNAGFVQYVSESGKWVDEDGSILIRVGAGGTAARDTFEAWYRIRKQHHARYPGFCARLDGITGTSLVIQRAE